MVGIAGNVARVATFHLADGVREAVPNRLAFAVFIPCAFDLIGGGCDAKNKFGGKMKWRESRLLRLGRFGSGSTTWRKNVIRRCSAERGQKFATIPMLPPAHEPLLDEPNDV